jgi:hypothetical protein
MLVDAGIVSAAAGAARIKVAKVTRIPAVINCMMPAAIE